jgi:hypothetical protein
MEYLIVDKFNIFFQTEQLTEQNKEDIRLCLVDVFYYDGSTFFKVKYDGVLGICYEEVAKQK